MFVPFLVSDHYANEESFEFFFACMELVNVPHGEFSFKLVKQLRYLLIYCTVVHNSFSKPFIGIQESFDQVRLRTCATRFFATFHTN